MKIERAFQRKLKKLPSDIQDLTLKVIKRPRERFCRRKKLTARKRVRRDSVSIRVTDQEYRAIAQMIDGEHHWYWCGTHEQYNSFIGK